MPQIEHRSTCSRNQIIASYTVVLLYLGTLAEVRPYDFFWILKLLG